MEAVGVSISQYAPHTYDAVWAIALALSKAENIWKNVKTENISSKIGLEYFDYDRSDMAEEFLYQMANLSFLGISVSSFK